MLVYKPMKVTVVMLRLSSAYVPVRERPYDRKCYH